MSVQWGSEEWPTADERWADQALFTEPQMRWADGGDGSDGGRIPARVWRNWLVAALVFYTVLALIVGALVGLL